MKGIFDLNTPKDLVKKLLFEFQNFSENPNDTYRAFNFFVTAEHIPDWIDEKNVRRKVPLLRICSHIANGAKHFDVDPKRHKSVENAAKEQTYGTGAYFSGDYAEKSLIVYLSDEESDEMGKTSFRAIQLAEMIVDYWSERFPGIKAE